MAVASAAPYANHLHLAPDRWLRQHLITSDIVQWKTNRINNNTRLTALCPGLPGWAGTRKVKPIWILLKQETVGGRGISWAIYKSAPRRREIPTPAPHHSIFYRPDALSATKPTASKQWRHTNRKSYVAYRMAPIAVTLSDPEGQFCCVKTISLPYLGKYSTCELQWIEQRVWLVISTVLLSYRTFQGHRQSRTFT